jgi:hypothetical protein
VAGSIPSGLTFTIPGDDFPAFSDVAVPNAGGLVVDSPASGVPVTPDTTFTWDASSNPDTYIEISVESTDITNFDPITLSFTTVRVTCEVKDDGSFEFDQDTQNAMDNDFSSTGLFGQESFSISRTATNVVQENNAILIINSTSGN